MTVTPDAVDPAPEAPEVLDAPEAPTDDPLILSTRDDTADPEPLAADDTA